MEDTYKIIRFTFNKKGRVIKRGLTLDEAWAHCADPETSSKGTSKKARAITARNSGNPWFDGYESETPGKDQ